MPAIWLNYSPFSAHCLSDTLRQKSRREGKNSLPVPEVPNLSLDCHYMAGGASTTFITGARHSRCYYLLLHTRTVEAGNFSSFIAGLMGLRTSSPPQFGHFSCRYCRAQLRQNVHSKEQITASAESGGRSVSQYSQPGLSSSIVVLSCFFQHRRSSTTIVDHQRTMSGHIRTRCEGGTACMARV